MTHKELMENELNLVNGGAEGESISESTGYSMEDVIRAIENSPNDAPEIYWPWLLQKRDPNGVSVRLADPNC